MDIEGFVRARIDDYSYDDLADILAVRIREYKKISEENSDEMDLENLSLKKMSVLLKDQDEDIIDRIRQSENVKSLEIAKNGRINLRIDSFDDMAVQNVLNTIISSGGIIKSIFTEEPSLEDVFIKSTSEVVEDDRA